MLQLSKKKIKKLLNMKNQSCRFRKNIKGNRRQKAGQKYRTRKYQQNQQVNLRQKTLKRRKNYIGGLTPEEIGKRFNLTFGQITERFKKEYKDYKQDQLNYKNLEIPVASIGLTNEKNELITQLNDANGIKIDNIILGDYVKQLEQNIQASIKNPTLNEKGKKRGPEDYERDDKNKITNILKNIGLNETFLNNYDKKWVEKKYYFIQTMIAAKTQRGLPVNELPPAPRPPAAKVAKVAAKPLAPASAEEVVPPAPEQAKEEVVVPPAPVESAEANDNDLKEAAIKVAVKKIDNEEEPAPGPLIVPEPEPVPSSDNDLKIAAIKIAVKKLDNEPVPAAEEEVFPPPIPYPYSDDQDLKIAAIKIAVKKLDNEVQPKPLIAPEPSPVPAPRPVPASSDEQDLKIAAIKIAFKKLDNEVQPSPAPAPRPVPASNDEQDLKIAAIKIAVKKLDNEVQPAPEPAPEPGPALVPASSDDQDLKIAAIKIAIKKLDNEVQPSPAPSPEPSPAPVPSPVPSSDEQDLKIAAIKIAIKKLDNEPVPAVEAEEEPAPPSPSVPSSDHDLKIAAIKIALKKLEGELTPEPITPYKPKPGTTENLYPDLPGPDEVLPKPDESTLIINKPKTSEMGTDAGEPETNEMGTNTETAPCPTLPAEPNGNNLIYQIYTPKINSLPPPIKSNTTIQPQMDGSIETTTKMNIPDPPYLLKISGTPGNSADTIFRIMMPSENSGTPLMKKGGGRKIKNTKKSIKRKI